jgi:hypothetical protein
MPALSKPEGQRRRRNQGKPTRELPAEGRRGRPPVLPRKRPAWLKETRDWWLRIWRSPSAAMWQEADYDVAVRLARIREELARRPDVAALHSAASQLEDRLGLSPRARRALGWEVGEARPPQEEPPAAAAGDVRGRVVELRRKLG